MKKERREHLVSMIMHAVATKMAYAHEYDEEYTKEEIQQVANWLGKLPTKMWEKFFPEPTN